eukprot:7539902-Pyramimonas_sp.AAC.1
MHSTNGCRQPMFPGTNCDWSATHRRRSSSCNASDGAAGIARAIALQTSLKLPNNQGWRQFEVLAVSGAWIALYVNPDKNAKDTRKE